MSHPTTVFADRRAHGRHAIRTSAWLALPGGQVIAARTLDIGNGGAGVVCDLNVPLGTAVALRTQLPARPAGSAQFDATAVVVNCTLVGSEGGFRLGLQFDPLSPAAVEALKGLIP